MKRFIFFRMLINYGVTLVSKILVVFLLAFTLRFVVIFCGLEFLIKNGIILDDTFIALSIARNVYLGKGFSFNGVDLTSGAQPLWPLILSLFCFLDKVTLTLFASFLSAFFFVLSAWFVFKITKKTFNERYAFFVLILYLFNPFLFFISLNGLETSLFIFLIFLSFDFFLNYFEKGVNKISLRLLIFSVIFFFITLCS